MKSASAPATERFLPFFKAVGLLLFLLFINNVGTAQQANNQLSKSWRMIASDQWEVDTSDRFELALIDNNEEQSFTWKLKNQTLSGSWELAGDTLTFILPPADTSVAIDSMAYAVQGGMPAVHFFRDSSLITSLEDGKFPTQSRIVHYQIDSIGDNYLALEGINQLGRYQFQPSAGTTFGIITFEDIWRGMLGMTVLIFLTYLMSANRRLINWRLVFTGLAIQLVFAFLVLKVEFVKTIFSGISSFFIWILDFSKYGATFLFGETLVNDPSFGAIFAFQILPTIVFFSALSSILYYLGIMQRIVFVFAWLMSRTMRLSGAESLAAAANIFIGQTEAPLVVKPYLDKMTKSEMLCLMVGGMATIAGGVFAAYVGFLGGNDPEQMQFFATHLLTASIMSAPAAIVAAKILYPEDQQSISRKIIIPKEKIGSNILDAISNGTTDGLKLAINVGAMLLTFTALIYMVNVILGNVGGMLGINEWIASTTDNRFDGLSLDYILGMALSPLAWILGTPSQDILVVGELLGKKTIVNEFIAYQAMEDVKAAGTIHSQKAIIIATYALCGFANFASIGIQIGGIGALAPSQRKLLAKFGIRALIGGTMAAFMTAVIAGAIV